MTDQTQGGTERTGWLTPGSGRRWAENRFGVDYHEVSRSLGKPAAPIIDVHAHVMGGSASRIYAEVADRFGVERVYSQCRLAGGRDVANALGDRVRFIAFPDWGVGEPSEVHRSSYMEVIRRWHGEFGARCVKFWGGPALWDMAASGGSDPADVVPFDSPWRIQQAELACELGMMIMVHIADPDTWFATKWSDRSKYRSKAEQYPGLEVMLRRYNDRPWIAAHMGGWPEDLPFLDGLLTRHPNLHLDTSATKWVVRALSGHPTPSVREFFVRWRGRILFGSDIVTTDDHLRADDGGHPRGRQAGGKQEAFELYASRYATLRTMFETDLVGESPIADPDLSLIDAERYDEMSAPTLRGLKLSDEDLRWLYRGTHEAVVGAWERGDWKPANSSPADSA